MHQFVGELAVALFAVASATFAALSSGFMCHEFLFR